MELSKISSKYIVRKLEEADIDIVYELSVGNPLFFEYCPPIISKEGVKADMYALPPNVTSEDKYYIGFFEEDKLVAVMDLITRFPDRETAYIGLFMMNSKEQGKGTGSFIVSELAEYVKSVGFKKIGLGIAKGNPQAGHFWRKNGFVQVGDESVHETYIAFPMERVL